MGGGWGCENVYSLGGLGGGGGVHVGWEEGSRGLLAAYLSIVAIFLKPHR